MSQEQSKSVKSMSADVLSVLFEHDPLGIATPDNPHRQSEYSAEADAIVRLVRLRKVSDEALWDAVKSVAIDAFGESNFDEDAWRPVAADIMKSISGDQ